LALYPHVFIFGVDINPKISRYNIIFFSMLRSLADRVKTVSNICMTFFLFVTITCK